MAHPCALLDSASSPGASSMRVHLARRAVRGATVGLGAAALAASGALVPLGAVAAEPGQQITLMGFNDFHGALGGASALACQVETVRAESETSFLFSAGDNVGGSAFESAVQNDEPTIDVLNALGVDASAIGNHEYDQGQDDLFDRIEPRTDFPDLAANVYDAEGNRVHDAYKIVERDGVKVAVIGAVTTKTVGKVSPAAVEGLDFGDPVDAVNDVVDELEAEGVEYDAAIALYHEGASGNGEPGAAPSNSDPIFDRIVSETDPEVDAIFNGDSHRTYAYEAAVPGQDGETRPIIQTGASAANLGTVTLERGAGDDTDWDVVTAPELRPTDAECTTSTDVTEDVTSIAKTAIDEAAVVGAEPVGSLTGDITTSWDDTKASYVDGVRTASAPIENQATTKGDNRTRHSAAGNMLADSMKWYLEDSGKAGENEVIGWMNPGGIRAELWNAESPTGEGDGVITYAEANNMVPFGNTLNSGEVTGAQFLQMLEEQWNRDDSGAFLAFSVSENIEYAYDSSAPLDERVFDVRVNGDPIDPDATYTIVTASFLFEGGDGMETLASAENVQDAGVLDRDAFTEYLRANPELEPDYSQRQIDVQFVEGDDENSPALRLSGLESQSLGAPEITSVTVDAGEYGTFEAPYGSTEPAAEAEEPVTMAAEGGLAAEVTLTDLYCVPTDTPESTVVPVTITAVPETGTEIVFDTVVEITGGTPEGCDDDGSTTPPPGDDDEDGTSPPPGGGDQGSDDQGSDDQGSDDQGSDDQGSDDQGTSTGGSAGAGTSTGVGSSTAGDPVGGAPTTADGRSDLARTGTNAGILAAIAGALTLTGAGAIALRHRIGRR